MIFARSFNDICRSFNDICLSFCEWANRGQEGPAFCWHPRFSAAQEYVQVFSLATWLCKEKFLEISLVAPFGLFEPSIEISDLQVSCTPAKIQTGKSGEKACQVHVHLAIVI